MPSVRPVTGADCVPPVTGAVAPPGDAVTVELVIPPPGAVQETVADASPAIATGAPGAAGGAVGVVAAEFGSTISDDSSMASNWEAGTVFSSLSRLFGQLASSVPLKNQLLPLSARINP